MNLPEPYFSSASARPATVPGTPMPSAESRDLALSGLPSEPEENIARCRSRRGLAIIDRDVLVAVGEMDHHEAAAADIAGAGIGDGQRKTGRDRGIDRVAALPQNVGADPRGDLLLRHDQAVLGDDRMNAAGGRRHIGVAREGARGSAKKSARAAPVMRRRLTYNRHHQIAPQVRGQFNVATMLHGGTARGAKRVGVIADDIFDGDGRGGVIRSVDLSICV